MNGEAVYKVMWEDETREVSCGSDYLEVKKAMDWKDDVLLVAVGGKAHELRSKVQKSCSIEPLTFDDERVRWALRHTAAHILAQAVKRLYPDAILGIGPAIETGFYYDFDVKEPFTPEDLEKIESEMRKIVAQDYPVLKEEIDRADARELFEKMGETYKVELIDDLPQGEAVSLYRQGEFVDLCAGPHVASTGDVKVFKLLSIAGAYWHGDERLPMLQRIYGTAFATEEGLQEHLEHLEEVKRRDHRRLAKDLDLFSLQEEGGPGLVYWHPKGSIVRETIEDFWRKEHRKRGYDIVYSPHIAKLDLWKTSGHWDWYGESMYAPMVVEGVEYLLKPMNCPFHILMYKNDTRSYRDLPIRTAELGTVYRYERSGVLHGALRVRGFTQDDAHLFVRPDQLQDELVGVLDLTEHMLSTFGYSEYQCMLSVRDPEDKSKYIGEDEGWELAEKALEVALKSKGLPYTIDPGEAKFYGPAIDVKIKDALGRLWQGPTIQVDFNLPERLDVNYIGEDGARHRPFIIHRTVLGSMERFVAGLVEHYGGAFPLWLAPLQVDVIPISGKQEAYAKKVVAAISAAGLRAALDGGPDKMGYKIRRAQMQKVSYMLVVGGREEESGNVAVRHRSRGDLGAMGLQDFIARAVLEANSRSLNPLVGA